RDLGARRLARLLHLHREALRDVAVREQLGRPALVTEAGRDQSVAVDGGAVIETAEVADVHDRVALASRITEAALRQTPLQRHLPALVAGRRVAARACAAPFVPTARGLAGAGADAAAE